MELYAALPESIDAAALIHAAVPEGASILELGAGTGRVTRPLLALRHPVVAVDESAGMLAHIRGAETVRSRIEDLRLGRTFDAVLLMSYLVAYGDRRPLLDACCRHVAPDGCVIVQREPRGWHETAAPRTWERDGVRYRMRDVERPGDGLVSATIDYEVDGRRWSHSFTSRRLGDEELPEVLSASGLRFGRFLDDDQSWILAHPA